MKDIFLYILLAAITFFPIVIWAYSFTYIDNSPINKKRFFLWILWWWLAVFPILNMDKIVKIFDIEYLNIFYYASELKTFFSSIQFWISLGLFLLFIVLFSFLLWWFIKNKLDIFKIYLKNILVFLVFIIFSVLLLFFIGLFLKNINFNIDNPVLFWNIVFDTLKLIVFYYFIIAFIEEASKHFNFLQSDVFKIKSIKDWVLYSIFIALWFSFIENILYLYNYYQAYWLNWELLKIYFFRSTFSVVLHILASSIVAYYFSKALILYRNKDLSFPYLKIFLFWLSLSIIIHMFFDIFLTLGFSFIIFLYFIGWYLYVSSIFYKD